MVSHQLTSFKLGRKTDHQATIDATRSRRVHMNFEEVTSAVDIEPVQLSSDALDVHNQDDLTLEGQLTL